METKFNVNQKVWIMFNNKPKQSVVKQITINIDGIYYWFSLPFRNGKESDSGICEDVLIKEPNVSETKDGLIQKIFNPTV